MRLEKSKVGQQITKEMLGGDGDALMGNKLQTVRPLKQPSFLSAYQARNSSMLSLEHMVDKCKTEESDLHALRWYLNFPNGAKRNDVELPAERIYFLCRCWLPSSTDEGMHALENARKEKKQVLSAIELTNARLNKIRSSPAAGNLLGDIVQNAFNFRHIVKLVERKKKLQSRLNELEKSYPLDSDKIMAGPNGISYAKDGVIAVKRQSKYLWVGRFKFTDMF